MLRSLKRTQVILPPLRGLPHTSSQTLQSNDASQRWSSLKSRECCSFEKLEEDLRMRGQMTCCINTTMMLGSNNLPVPPSPTSTNLNVGMSSPVVILKLNRISAISVIEMSSTKQAITAESGGALYYTMFCNKDPWYTQSSNKTSRNKRKVVELKAFQ